MRSLVCFLGCFGVRSLARVVLLLLCLGALVGFVCVCGIAAPFRGKIRVIVLDFHTLKKG